MGQGPLKRYTIEQFKREIAPAELNSLNEITTSKYLEQIENGNTSLLRYLEHTGHELGEVNK